MPPQVFDEHAHAGQQVEAGVFVEGLVEKLALALHQGLHFGREVVALFQQLKNVARRLAQERGVFGSRNGNAQLGELREESVVVQRLGVDKNAVHVEDYGVNHADGNRDY